MLVKALEGNTVSILVKTDKDMHKVVDIFVDYLQGPMTSEILKTMEKDYVIQKYDLAIRMMSNLPIFIGKKKDVKLGEDVCHYYDFTAKT